MNPKVKTRHETGYIFQGDRPQSYCFVPEDCVYEHDGGRLAVDEIKYFLSGWSVRNRRLNEADTDGAFLFPDSSNLIIDFDTPPLMEFLERISRYTPAPAPTPDRNDDGVASA